MRVVVPVDTPPASETSSAVTVSNCERDDTVLLATTVREPVPVWITFGEIVVVKLD
jgi:hypothetical protein